ncbi:myotubularin-related protein 7a [Hypomesus transpacificus]|uniref:myotubularin-related protein 7a n=1 Tax=Hypomesus transpacificus TaxID=137520 RepID=UPI001F0871BB|nr:myotubularin-related protein 7a [Hypomesus transpacificus]XP_046880726.1 myotubularin-related protein 7a [Hypomesus transpacificus]XP_046880734.1 myotubularin-related protein 7a [Hypomesus transpacificus]
MEHIRLPKVENVRLIDRISPRRATLGTMYLTATHTIFVENETEIRTETWVLHSLVYSVEKLSTTATGCPLLIHCKNFQVLHFIIPQERDCHDVHMSLIRLSHPECYEELYCFSYNPNSAKEERQQGWAFVDLKAEYSRMGLPNSLWKVTPVNCDYKVSDTYPADLYVPKSATPPVIVGSSKFRSRGRFPTLAYYCRENHAAICRSSQPLSGFSARCVEDEQMLEAIVRSNPRSDFMYVVDTRPRLNAMANRAAGKGYENEDNYSNIKFQFLGIENIHVMRNSLQKMLEVSELRSPSMSDFLEGVGSSGWLKHIKAVLDTGIFIAKAISEEGVSVLVHCSDGWDRTAQVCSVACVLLDPFYRTLKGLMVLIERDWVSFGHKFSHRYNHLDGDPKEVSPVLDQLLECVWQLMEQFPCAFEFNERFLMAIHSNIYSCQYGNFIGNSQRERLELGLCEKTHSLWFHLWKNRSDYMNPLYRPDHSQTQGVLRPDTAPYCFKFWKALYNRFDRGMHPRQSVLDYLMAIREETQQLEEQLASHEERIEELEKQPGKSLQMQPDTLDQSHAVWALHPPDIGLALANTPQDYTGGFLCSSPCQLRAPESALLILNKTDPELSTNQESGIADISFRSPPSEDSVKDPDSDEAAYSAA